MFNQNQGESDASNRVNPLLVAIVFFAFIATGLSCSTIWKYQINIKTNWKSYYDGLISQGKDCAFSIEQWSDAESFESIAARQFQTKPIIAPWRGNPDAPVLVEGQFLYLRCIFNLGYLKDTGFASLMLGPVYGDSAIFLDGKLKALQDDNGNGEFPLLPEERKDQLEVLIISKWKEGHGRLGLPTLMPPVASNDRAKFDAIINALNSFDLDMPVLQISHSAALMLLFSVCWILGVRYRDVSWIIIFLGLLTLRAYFDFNPTNSVESSKYLISSPVGFACDLACIGFLAMFFRLKIRKYVMEIVLLSLLAAYTLLVHSVTYNFYLKWQINQYVPAIVLFFGLIYVLYRSQVELEEVPLSRKIRYRALQIIVLVVLFVSVAESIVVFKYAISIMSFIDLMFAGLFACLMAADLVVFHRQYFQEKADRIREEQQKIALEERMALGKAVQELLLPKSMDGEFYSFKFKMLFQSFDKMSGDWIQRWQSSDELRLLIGDVTGKGPPAALAVATISAINNQIEKHRYSVEEGLNALNGSLLALYGGNIATTVSGLRISEGGEVEVFNCAGLGWLHFDGEKVNHIVMPSSFLGMEEVFSIGRRRLLLNRGDWLIGFTDGICEGGRGLRALRVRLSKELKTNVSFDDVFNIALEVGRGHVLGDDRTMVCVKMD